MLLYLIASKSPVGVLRFAARQSITLQIYTDLQLVCDESGKVYRATSKLTFSYWRFLGISVTYGLTYTFRKLLNPFLVLWRV